MDYNFTSVANHNEQVLTLTNIVPSYAKVISLEIICAATLAGSGTHAINFEAGNSSSGNEYVEFIEVGDAGDVGGIIKQVTVQGNASSSSSIYITADPDANWDTFTAGRWMVYVTYLRLPGSIW